MKVKKSRALLLAAAAAFSGFLFVAPQAVRAAAPIAPGDVSPAGIAGYQLLKAANNGQFTFYDGYNVDNSASHPTGSFNRVAYYVELSSTVNAQDHRFVWVSMDAFNADPAKVGLPQAGTGIVEQGTPVTNLHIESNHPNLASYANTNSANGDIEFWASNYDPNGGGVYGSNDNLFDWKDGGQRDSTGGHGSFQVFALNDTKTAGQTLFGITGNGGSGIGNQPSTGGANKDIDSAPDWTFGPGTGSYAVRNLEIYVASVPEPTSLGLLGVGGLGLLARRRRV